MSYSLLAIKAVTNKKIYIYEDRIHLYGKDQSQASLKLDAGYEISLPILLRNKNGFYLPNSDRLLAKKPFKNVCNNCQYEWEKGGIVIWCPRCKSTDIRSNVPNT